MVMTNVTNMVIEMAPDLRKIREEIFRDFTQEQINLVSTHLLSRSKERKTRPELGIVYDLLSSCNLQCKGCSVSPKYINRETPFDREQIIPKYEDIFHVLRKIKDYVSKNNQACFISYGGGEPFLRPDLEDIIISTSEMFGGKNIGIDTNGTVTNQLKRIEKIGSYFSYLGISLDGLEDYHNWWRGGNVQNGAFKKTVSLLRELVSNPELSSKVEVTSVPTKNNLNQLPLLMEYLNELGIKRYSIHRAMPVGRMEKLPNLIPSARDYFHLLVDALEKADALDMDFHMHHSIESIYMSILLGIDTYNANKVGDPDVSSSIGIEPMGTVVFDPWSMHGSWVSLNGGNLMDQNSDLGKILDSNNSILQIARTFTEKDFRCHGCKVACSGGSRIAAAGNDLFNNYGKKSTKELTQESILTLFSAVDPACPLYNHH